MCAARALHQSANFVFTTFVSSFRWKTVIYESPGSSLEKRSAGVVMSQLYWFPVLDHRNHETTAFTASSGGIAENNGEASKALWILPYYFVVNSQAHSLDRIFF